MACEGQSACAAIDTEHRDVVPSLIAGIKESAGRIEVKAARIVSMSPFLRDEGQLPSFANREYPNTVVQTVARIDEPAIVRDQDLSGEITAGESGRQAGDSLPVGQPSVYCIVVEQDDVRTFFLEGVAPASVRVKGKMPRPVPWRE